MNGTRSSLGRDGATGLVAEIWRAGDSDAAVDAAILLFVAALLTFVAWRRPKTTGSVAAVWLLWLVCKILGSGHSAWDELSRHAQCARDATESFVHAMLAMLGAWLVLFLPILQDAWRVSEPMFAASWRQAVHVWRMSSWHQKGVTALATLAISNAALVLAALHRHQEVVVGVLFQLSFLVIGPALWWVASSFPHEIVIWLADVVISIAPAALSLRVLCSLQRERDGQSAEAKATLACSGGPSWFAPPAEVQGVQSAEVPSSELLERLCFWLSYWSCWPFLHVTYVLLTMDLVPEDDRSAADGLLLTLALWAQVWNASRIAPQLFAACSICLGGVSKRFYQMGAVSINEVAGTAWQTLATLPGKLGELSNNRMLLGGVIIVALTVASFFLRVMAIASAFLALGLLIGIAVASASCAARRDAAAAPGRLAFWTLAIAWLGICRLPLLGTLLEAWTPGVLLLAAGAGDLALAAELLALRWAAAAVDSWSPAAAAALGLDSDGGSADDGGVAARGCALLPNDDTVPHELAVEAAE